MWRKGEKLKFLESNEITWKDVTPDAKNNWLIAEHADEWSVLQPVDTLFGLHSNGVKTNRDAVVYDWDQDKLAARVKQFIVNYNAEVRRHESNPDAVWPDHLAWSETLKKAATKQTALHFAHEKLVRSLYRPFTTKWLYFDQLLNERVYQWPNIAGRVLTISDIAWRAPSFSALMGDSKADSTCAQPSTHTSASPSPT